MVNLRTPSWVCIAAMGLWGPASAQAQATPVDPATHNAGNQPSTAPMTVQPLNPLTASVPSALASYQAYADTPVLPWRESNDRVHAVGGWKAYARQVQATTPSPKEPKP